MVKKTERTTTEEEAKVLSIIKGRKGRKRAICVDSISILAGCSSRRVRLAVACLIKYHQCLIGSSTEKPHGFFYIHTKQEFDEIVENLYHRAAAIEERALALRETAHAIGLREVPGRGISTGKGARV